MSVPLFAIVVLSLSEVLIARLYVPLPPYSLDIRKCLLSSHECEFISKFMPRKNETESQNSIERKPADYVRVSPGESLADLSVTFFSQPPKGFMKGFTR